MYILEEEDCHYKLYKVYRFLIEIKIKVKKFSIMYADGCCVARIGTDKMHKKTIKFSEIKKGDIIF